MGKLPHARVRGPLAPLAEGFRLELARLGYTPMSLEIKVNQMAGLSRWLGEHGLDAGDVDRAAVEGFLEWWGAGRKRRLTARAMRPLVDWLVSTGVIAVVPAASGGPVEVVVADYRRWMVRDRGLAARTVGRYEQTARRFLAGRSDDPPRLLRGEPCQFVGFDVDDVVEPGEVVTGSLR